MCEFKTNIEKLANESKDEVFFNSDSSKMRIVFETMFRHSKYDMYIFAGSLCNETTESYEYIDAVSDFIDRGGRLWILLNDCDKSKMRSSNLFSRLYYYIAKGKDVKIRTTKDVPFIKRGGNKIPIHFAVGDRTRYRIEDDTLNRTAICNMGDPSLSLSLAKLFENIFHNFSEEEIDLRKLYKEELYVFG